MPFPKRFIKVLCLLPILTACQTVSSENISANSSPQSNISLGSDTEEPEQSVHPVLQPTASKLATKTNIPIKLPGYLPEYPGGPALQPILVQANESKYEIMLAYTPDCSGGNACRLGKIVAEMTKDISSLNGEQTVTLNNGSEAYFTDAECGANCNDSTLTWEQDSIIYTLGVKAGKIEMLVKMANSMS